MKRIEQSIKFIPLGGIFIILCSSIKQIIYYCHFNIPIADYLGLQEYATLFIDDILLYTLMFGIAIILNYSISDEEIENRFKHIKNKKKDFKKSKLVFIILFLISIVVILLVIFFVDDVELKLRRIKPLMWASILFLYYLLLYSAKKVHYIFFVLSALIIYVIFDANLNALKVTDYNKEYNYHITKTDGELIRTNEKLNFLGKSEKYLFLFDQTHQSATIIKVDDVNEIK